MAQRFDEILTNFPVRPAAWLLRLMVLPFGPRHRGPSDRVTMACADLLMEPSATRDRVTTGLYAPSDDGGVARLNKAFKLVVAAQPIRDRMRKARVHDVKKARAQNIINDAEAAQLDVLAKAVADVINVDDFAPDELTHGVQSQPNEKRGDVPSPVHHAAE
jgi:acyl-CoA dehydrogenase